jgi:glycosyl transferase family 25
MLESTLHIDGIFTKIFGHRERERARGLSLPFPVYLINLDRATVRRRFALRQLASIGVNPVLIHAVDGSLLELPQLVEEGVYSPADAEKAFSRQLSMPEIGCSLSHYHIYQEIVDRGDDVALVLEDDALFLPRFSTRLKEAYEELPENWGLLNLNCRCTRYENISKELVKYDGVGALPVASSAYLISGLGARLMVENALPLRYPADSLIGRGLRWGVETYGPRSPLTSINNWFPTQIQDPKGINGHVKYSIKTAISAFFYRDK